MTNQQKQLALRLAEELEHDPTVNRPSVVAELRRLHAENTTLQQGYDAARLEIDSLQARVQELGAMLRENCNRRIVELEAQLEAIGAGGVEPLRRRECLHQIEEPETAAQPPAGWWRQRADEIELEVAQGKSNAMRCYTDMRALLQAAAAPKAEPGEPVHGDVLPPVGSRVYIRHGRDNDAHACTVTGYYAWGDLGGDKRLHRVFVRLVYEGTDIQQARMLCDCYPTAEAALAQAAPQQEAQEPCPACIALARTVMLDQVSFDRKPDCYGIRQITDDEGIEEWEDIRTSPDVAREEANDMMATGRGEIYEVVPLWTTPQPSPTPKSDIVLEDAMAWPKPGPQNPTWTICPKFLEKIMRSSASEYMPGLEEIEAVLLGLRTLFSASRVDLPGWESWPPDAQAEDSALEDAARYRWLVDYLIDDRYYLDDEIIACASKQELDAVIDAAMAAASKQGANHD